MKLTKSSKKLFNDDHYEIIELLNIANDYFLNGSFEKTLWASDIDLYQEVKINSVNDMNKFLDELKELISDLIKDKNISLQEIKIGDKKVKTNESMEKLTSDDILGYLMIGDKKRIKIDLIANINGYLEEITIIYDLETFEDTEENFQLLKKSIMEDVMKFYKAKNYIKIFKRIQSLLRVKQETKQLTKKESITFKLISDMLQDSYIGLLYLSLSRLNALIDNKHISKLNVTTALSNIKEDVGIKLHLPDHAKKLEHFSKANIKTVVNKLKKQMNNAIVNTVRSFIN